ncbi:hypothetical protein HDU99_005745, partial [Rhizoclosmatium hyalinum]
VVWAAAPAAEQEAAGSNQNTAATQPQVESICNNTGAIPPMNQIREPANTPASIDDVHKTLSNSFQTRRREEEPKQSSVLYDLEDEENDFDLADEDDYIEEEGLEFYGASNPNENEQTERQPPATCEKDWPKLEKGTPLFQYVESIVGKLKQQLSQANRVDCYENRTFWIHLGESVFDRLKGKESFSYYRDCLLDIFVWIPHLLVTVNCPWCGTEATNSGFAHNPTGRIISGFRNYVLVTYAYECKLCPKWGKKKHFYGSSKACLDTLEPELSGCFCPILTKKGGIDRELADFFIPCFMSGMGPQKFAAAAKETAAKRKDRKELSWIMAVNRRLSGGRTVVDMLTGKTSRSLLAEVPEYPDYNSDFVPSANYFRGMSEGVISYLIC